MSLSIYYQNCRGLRTKLNTLYINILAHNYDVIILTETWLHEGIHNNELFDARYRVYRQDRDRAGSGRRDGGGVLVAVHRQLPATLMSPLPADSAQAAVLPISTPYTLVDSLLIDIRSRNYRCIISAAYIPPNLSSEIYNLHFGILTSILHSNNVNEFMIVGDYNLPTLEWQDCGTFLKPILTNNCCLPNKYLINFIATHNCVQINKYRNKRGRILDLFITNLDNASISSTMMPLVQVDPNHPAFFVLAPLNKFNISTSLLTKKHSVQFNFNKANYDIINTEIANIDWNSLSLCTDAEAAVSLFYEKIYNIIKQHIPTKINKTSHFPVWFSPALIHIFKNKNKAWIKWKKYKNIADYQVFSMFRARFKMQSKQCYNKYITSIEQNIKVNIKYFWSYVNNKRKGSDVPIIVSYNNTRASNPEDICNYFSMFFKSVFVPSSITDDYDINSIPDTNHSSNLILSNVNISERVVLHALRQLDISKGPGLDNIPPVFLRSTAATLCQPICYIFNLCLKEGTFPTIWKSARIVPVFKSGDRSDVENYRPISILPTLSKLFERLVHNSIYPSLHNIIIPQQHGFVKRRSTVTNLLIYTTHLFECLDKNKQVDSVYTDFRKAFDRVDHKLLLDKLAYNGIKGSLWRWFKSYITNRTQKVVLNGYESNFVPISSGVPQGSILGPLLFILFINDVSKCFRFCDILLYADDLKIFHTVENSDDHDKFQSDLDRFTEYCAINKLSLSVSKCKTITFTKKKRFSHYTYLLDGIPLEKVESIRDLGVTLDDKLHLNLHIDNIINKAYKMYGLVMRASSEFKRPCTLLYLYKALVRSQLEYAVPIWNPFYNNYIKALEIVQKKFLRNVQYKCFRSRLPYSHLLEKFKLLKLVHRRTLLEMTTLYDLCNNKYDCIPLINRLCYKIPARVHSRNPCRLFSTFRCRTNSGKRSPLHRMVNAYNDSFNGIDIMAENPGRFRRLLRDELSNRQMLI